MTKQNSEKSGLGTKAAIIIIAAVMLSAALVPFTYDTETDNTILGDGGSGIWGGASDVATEFAGGTGTLAEPYLISNGAELAYLRVVGTGTAAVDTINGGMFNSASKYYALTDDIYLNDTDGWELWDDLTAGLNSWIPIGGTTAAASFRGNFDGDDHAVYGMYVTGTTYRGLFGYVTGGNICKLGIEQSYIGGTSYIGGIAGYICNNSKISFCYNAATVEGSGFRIGGIVGQAYDNSTVTYCYNTGDVRGIGTGTGSNSIGGIAGIVNGNVSVNLSVVSNCYNLGNVSGTRVGGVVGQLNRAVLVNCYNAGTVSGSNVGGVVGYMITSNIFNVYNIGDVLTDDTGGFVVGAHSGGGTTDPSIFYLEDKTSGLLPDNAVGDDPSYGESFNDAGDLASDTLKNVLNDGRSGIVTILTGSPYNLLTIECDKWVGGEFPILEKLTVKVSLIYGDNGTASISPTEENIAKGTAFKVTVTPDTGCIGWTVKDNGVLVLDDTDAIFTYEFVAHKGHLIVVSFQVEETGPVIGPVSDPDGNGTSAALVILAALIIFVVLFIGWLYKRRKDEDSQ